MYSLPEQTLEQALEDVRAACALEPLHISHYQLTLEPGTVFHSRPPPLPDEDAAFGMQNECQSLLAEHGFEQYEVSAYAGPARAAGTISTIGNMEITWASARVPTARSRRPSPRASREPKNPASPGPISPGCGPLQRFMRRRSVSASAFLGAICPSNTCSMRSG